MIIKSHIRGGFRDAAAYLKEQGKNEHIRLVEMSDPHVKNLDEAFRAMWAISEGTKVKKPIHHISINPMKDERLTDEQVRRICAHLEDKYGYPHGEHQRVIVEHIRDGRQHFHVMWNRVNMVTGKPHYPYMHKMQSKIAARELEEELGLKKPVSKRARTHETNKASHARTNKTFAFRQAAGSAAWRGTNPVITRNYKSNYTLASHLITIARITRPRKPKHSPAQPLPTRPAPRGITSGMSEAQRIDFLAACKGLLSWRDYFIRWGDDENKPNIFMITISL